MKTGYKRYEHIILGYRKFLKKCLVLSYSNYYLIIVNNTFEMLCSILHFAGIKTLYKCENHILLHIF